MTKTQRSARGSEQYPPGHMVRRREAAEPNGPQNPYLSMFSQPSAKERGRPREARASEPNGCNTVDRPRWVEQCKGDELCARVCARAEEMRVPGERRVDILTYRRNGRADSTPLV